jgi:hypothetical protein
VERTTSKEWVADETRWRLSVDTAEKTRPDHLGERLPQHHHHLRLLALISRALGEWSSGLVCC